MPPHIPGSVDSLMKFEDLSGVSTSSFSNPYDALIEACEDDPAQLQARYSLHRTSRNEKQKTALLSSDFNGLILDSILQKLNDPTIEPGYIDPRNCLVFWARPPQRVRDLVGEIQQRLKVLAPNIWLMPLPNLHLTALEVTHSLTPPALADIVSQIEPIIPALTDFPHDPSHRARLIKPLLSFDSAAVALSFLPAAGEGLSIAGDRRPEDDKYTYHHLRRSLFELSTTSGVAIESRYVVPSAHLTVGRFISQKDHDSPEKMQNWIGEIEAVNEWLKLAFWPSDEPGQRKGLEWVVGEGLGLDAREGRLWYGGGNTIRIGKGF